MTSPARPDFSGTRPGAQALRRHRGRGRQGRPTSRTGPCAPGVSRRSGPRTTTASPSSETWSCCCPTRSARGAARWLRAHNRLLGHERPIDVLAAGRVEKVRGAAPSVHRRLLRVSLADDVASPRRTITGLYWHQRTTRHHLVSAVHPARSDCSYHRGAGTGCGRAPTRNRLPRQNCSATSSTRASTPSRCGAASVACGSVSRRSTLPTTKYEPVSNRRRRPHWRRLRPHPKKSPTQPRTPGSRQCSPRRLRFPGDSGLPSSCVK